MSNRRLEKTLKGNERKEVKNITIQENIQNYRNRRLLNAKIRGK